MNIRGKGFTLLEMLIVVVIIGVLVAVALPEYMKALERSRMAEAVVLLANIAHAQERKYIQTNHYSANFLGLDIQFKKAQGVVFYTHEAERPSGGNGNGDSHSQSENSGGTGGNVAFVGSGFEISISGTELADGIAVAERYSHNTSLRYEYTLSRYYTSQDTSCTGANEKGASLCADFCGLDTLAVNTPCCNTGVEGNCPQPVF